MPELTPNLIGYILAVFGITVAPEHVPAFLTASGVIGAAVIAAIPVVLKNRADKRASVTTQMQSLIDELRKDRDEDRKKIARLENEMVEIRLQKDLDRATIGKLNDKVRDLQEENDDLWGYARQIARWEASGATPPLPTRPWRLKDCLAQAEQDGLL